MSLLFFRIYLTLMALVFGCFAWQISLLGVGVPVVTNTDAMVGHQPLVGPIIVFLVECAVILFTFIVSFGSTALIWYWCWKHLPAWVPSD